MTGNYTHPEQTPFSLHANVSVLAHRRDQLEWQIRSTARGAVSLERLEEDANGDLLYTFTRPWSDGTTGIKLSPLELLEKLAALVPLPRVRLVRSGSPGGSGGLCGSRSRNDRPAAPAARLRRRPLLARGAGAPPARSRGQPQQRAARRSAALHGLDRGRGMG